MNLGSAVILPEVLLKAVSVARNFGHPLDGLVTVNVDKESRYRSTVNVVTRPSAAGEGLELIGHHEILLPLLPAAPADPASEIVDTEPHAATAAPSTSTNVKAATNLEITLRSII